MQTDSQSAEPKVRDIVAGKHTLYCGRLKCSQLLSLVYNQTGTSFEVVTRAWQAIEESLKLGGHPYPAIENLQDEFDATEFRDLYVSVLRHSKAYETA